jgi:hypothetical protein
MIARVIDVEIARNWTSALFRSRLMTFPATWRRKAVIAPETAPSSSVFATDHLDGTTFSPRLVNQRSARRNNNGIALDLGAIDRGAPTDQNASHAFVNTPPKDCSC